MKMQEKQCIRNYYNMFQFEKYSLFPVLPFLFDVPEDG